MANVASHESLAAMGDLVSKLIEKHEQKNKQILDGDFTSRKRKKISQVSKKELSEKRRQKKELMQKGKQNASHSDIVYERKLNKIATGGVIQLFNAVKQHQKDIDQKLKRVKTEAQRDKVNQSVTTGSFLDLVRPKQATSDTKSEDQKWNVLKEDFLMNNKPKDWEKGAKEDSEEEESDGDIASDESDEGVDSDEVSSD